MNILVACEESQEVCKELRKRGHRAFSCDIQECSGGHPEWHILGDVTSLVNGNCTFKLQNRQTDRQIGKWDMIIAFPPCTHLAVSGARHFEQKRKDGRQREGIEIAKAEGKYKGRPARITDKFIYCAKAWSEGKMQLKEAIAESGVSEPTFFRQCKKLGIKKSK